jgi:hypothetical protein
VVDSERLAAESSIRNVLESIPGQLTESSLPEPTPLPEPSGLPAVLAPLPTQLVWGRFSFSPSLPVSLPLSFANASQGRDVTVGDFSRYALWREGEQTLEPQLKGRVDFQVSAVEAYLEPRVGPPSVANVEAARLGIDFDAARFEAAFRVNHPVAGRHRVEASGSVRPDGLFAASEPGQRVAGAVTANGQEAGVFFSKDISDGSLRGLSLWRAGQ